MQKEQDELLPGSTVPGDAERQSPTATSGLLQHLYDVTTWLLSVAPTGRVDQGAYVPYHDALVALSDLSSMQREGRITRRMRYWVLRPETACNRCATGDHGKA